MADHEFVTNWQFNAPLEQVWNLIFAPERWPEWWRGVEKVEKLKDGDANHVGAIHRYTWKSKLPYRLISKWKQRASRPVGCLKVVRLENSRVMAVGSFQAMAN